MRKESKQKNALGLSAPHAALNLVSALSSSSGACVQGGLLDKWIDSIIKCLIKLHLIAFVFFF